MEKGSWPIRAHHGMCLAFFEGKGYSDGFTAHMERVKRAMAENPRICVTDGADVICTACPNNQNGVCTDGEKVLEYDRQVLLRCGLKPGQELYFREFQKVVYEQILLPEKREEICGNCQWTQLCHFQK